MKKIINFIMLFILPYATVVAQVNPPTHGSGLINFYENCPVYNDVLGEVIGHLFTPYASMGFAIKFNNGESVTVKDWLEMSCCDSNPELLFFERKDGFAKIARSSNNGKGVWLKEDNLKDSSITAIPWQTMILNTINGSDEFFFMSKKKSIQLFKDISPKSDSETLINNGKWYIKPTGKVKENWIEVIAIKKKFELCYEYYPEEENEKQQDLQTVKGYIELIDKSGLPTIWFLICEM